VRIGHEAKMTPHPWILLNVIQSDADATTSER
jgi:hypothetical protein